MLKSIQTKNFKCFKDTGNITFAPLTFFLGPNCAGKSSIFQLILMLKQTADSSDRKIVLNPNGELVKLGSFPELLYKGNMDNSLNIIMNFSYANQRRGLHLDTNLKYDQNRKKVSVQNSVLNIEGSNSVKRKIDFDGKQYNAKVELKEHVMNLENVNVSKYFDFNYSFDKIFDKFEEKKLDIRDVSTAAMVPQMFINEMSRIFYVGPLRDYPKHVYVTSGQKPEGVGSKGENAIDILSAWNNDNEKSYKDKFKNIEKWLKTFNFGDQLKIASLSKYEDYYKILLKDPATKHKTTLANTGFGVSQLIPILIESFTHSKGDTILLEQPEIHLHPKAQCDLGDMLIEANISTGAQFVIETHSEHILSRICRRVAEGEGKIKSEDIKIYYFSKENNQTKISEIEIDENGQYIRIPEGFFEEDYNEVTAHINAIGKKKS